MIFDVFRLLNHAILIAGLSLLGAAALYQFWIVATFLRLRREGMAREAAELDLPLPNDADLPHVLVQVPTLNEQMVIKRVIEAVGALDWPSDRLHIQIVDSSTDETPLIAERALAILRSRGLDAQLLHEVGRPGFKAGQLRDGLRCADHEYVAVFDADCLPQPNFLRLCMRPLLADPKIGFVQARSEFINAADSALTGSQQRMIDADSVVGQAARNWSGNFTQFCGHSCVWRRRAIDDAGGWQSDTLCEDVDLCCRAFLRGWSARALVGVTVPTELPGEIKSWSGQQFRWTKGFAQVTRKHLRAIWRSKLALSRKLIMTMHLTSCMTGPLLALTVIAASADIFVHPGLTAPVIGLILFALLTGAGAACAIGVLGQQMLRGANPLRELLRMPAVIGFHIYSALTNMDAVFDVLRGKQSAFVRTPKTGAAARRDSAAGP